MKFHEFWARWYTIIALFILNDRPIKTNNKQTENYTLPVLRKTIEFKGQENCKIDSKRSQTETYVFKPAIIKVKTGIKYQLLTIQTRWYFWKEPSPAINKIISANPKQNFKQKLARHSNDGEQL